MDGVAAVGDGEQVLQEDSIKAGGQAMATQASQMCPGDHGLTYASTVASVLVARGSKVSI